MKQCPNCRSQIQEEAVFCPVCGTSISALHSFPEPYPPQTQYADQIPPYQNGPVYSTNQAKPDPHDHTELFESSDISENKNWCMLLYLLDIIGIALVLLRRCDSEYIRFHMAQSLKFTILEALLAFGSVLLSWTLVVPVVGGIAILVLMILKLVSFVQVCKGKAVEPALVRSIGFLK